MMSTDNQNLDLRHALGYPSNCTRIRMNENSGAGVNAGSLKFPASDSLAELVWSPQKGPSLKRAQASLPDKKKPFLLWNVGPSNGDPSPSQSIRCKENDDDKIVLGNLVISKADLDSEADQSVGLAAVSSKNSATRILGSVTGLNLRNEDDMEEGVLARSGTQNVHLLGDDEKEVCDLANQQKDSTPGRGENDAGFLSSNLSLQGLLDFNCDLAKAEASFVNLNEEVPNDLNHTSENAAINCQISEEGSRAAEGHAVVQSDAHFSLQILPRTDKPTMESKGGANDLEPSGGKLDYTAENDLQEILLEKDAYQWSKERLVKGCSIPENQSNHFHQLKGKEKALSEGNVNRRFSDYENDSQESVESCNSACILGKRWLHFSEEQMVESKRMKRDVDENGASTSMIRGNSSFMTWISNMVNGFSKSNQEDGPSLDLTLAHSSYEDTSNIKDNVICSSRLQEPISRNTGFQTVFQSLYCPNSKLLEAGTSENDCDAQEHDVPRLLDDTDVPISLNSFSEQNGVSCNHKLTSDEKILLSTAENVLIQTDQALILSAISPIQNVQETDSAEIKESGNQECRVHENGTNASVSLADQKITTSNNGNHNLGFDGRATCELSNKGNLSGSLWITRFSKVCNSTLNLDNSNKDHRPANPQAQISPDFPTGEKCSDTGNKSNENLDCSSKELQTFADIVESSGSKKMHEHNNEDIGLKLDSVQPSSSKFRTPEAMASTFARRLDALKHITPAAVQTNGSSRMRTCFFCGKSGHNLQKCCEVTEPEPVDVATDKAKSSFIDKEDNLKDVGRLIEYPMSNGKEFSGYRRSNATESRNQINLKFREKRKRELQSLPLTTLVSMEITEAPTGVFDAVRRLRLSRADMLKWINSSVSLSQLEGLFLRLRLGKWEAGLGGTGYYVARITVEQSGEPVEGCKKSISVNVGGMKCLVGSQYISNHDFLEDELMVWWRRIVNSGGNVPSKEDLEAKFKRRITLGF